MTTIEELKQEAEKVRESNASGYVFGKKLSPHENDLFCEGFNVAQDFYLHKIKDLERERNLLIQLKNDHIDMLQTKEAELKAYTDIVTSPQGLKDMISAYEHNRECLLKGIEEYKDDYVDSEFWDANGLKWSTGELIDACKDAWDACYNHLLTLPNEWDAQQVKQARDDDFQHGEYWDTPSYIEGARWQHEQSKARENALREEAESWKRAHSIAIEAANARIRELEERLK